MHDRLVAHLKSFYLSRHVFVVDEYFVQFESVEALLCSYAKNDISEILVGAEGTNQKCFNLESSSGGYFGPVHYFRS